MTDALSDTLAEMVPAWINGTLTPVEKLEVHQRGLKHKAVSVFVLDGSKVLIQQRALSKYHTPGLWANTCCTHPRWNEPPADCAVRRLDDELGIKGLFPAHRDTIEYRADVGGGMTEHEVVDIYLAHADASLKIVPNPDEVEAYKWIDFYDLCAEVARRPKLYTPWLRIYLSEHRSKIFASQVQV